MVTCCSVVGCRNVTDKAKGVRMFNFPKVKKNCISANKNQLVRKRRKAWFAKLNRKDIKLEDLNTRRICSAHFISGKPADVMDVNDPDWIPSINMGKIDVKLGSDKTSYKYNTSRRTERYAQREIARVSISSTSPSPPEEISYSNSSIEINEDGSDVSASTIVDNNTPKEQLENDSQCKESIDVWGELQKRTEEVFQLRQEIQRLSDRQLTKAAFMKDEVKLKFYTGLPSLQVFQLIQNAIDDSLSSLKFTAIDNFQMLLLTLMKLRMNSSFIDLGYRFGIRADSASLIFKKVIIFLYHALNEFIIWPSRDAAKVLIPACFRNNFGDKFAIILDCFEVTSTQKPSSLRANQQSFSNYKDSTNTVKYLIGITPHGVVSFVSKGYEGRVSDRVITEDCGILKNLLPGDVVLLDQGFTINELVVERQAVKVPDSTRGQAQLQPSPVENTPTIASVRIHVGRIIGEIRNKYAIMNGPISTELLRNMYQNERLLDFIVKVCCILANFCDSIVPIGE